MKDRPTFLALCAKTELSKEEMDSCQSYGWFPSSRCRYCGLTVDAGDSGIAFSYWQIHGSGPGWFRCHESCRATGYAMEAVECQKIDSDCNDCANFVRQAGNCGVCAKTGLPERANPNFSSCRPCFKHRKEGVNP